MLRLLALLLLLPATLFAQASVPGGPPGAGGGVIPFPVAPGWVEETAAAAWSERAGATAVAHDNRLWVMGGMELVSGVSFNDVWSSADGINWMLETSSAAWTGRCGHASVVFNGRIWVLGGLDAPFSPRNDVWSSPDGISWTQETAAAAWSPRMLHGATVFNNRMWLMGGYGNAGKNDVWSSPDGVNWTQETAAAAWAPRLTSVEVFNSKLWVLGGTINPSTTGATLVNDVWSSADGITWTQGSSTGPVWSPRVNHRTAVYGGRLWILGGEDGGFSYAPAASTNDVWSTTDGASWNNETASAGWKPRALHAAAVFDNRVWVLGGSVWTLYSGGGASWKYDNSVWSYEETAPQITSAPVVTAMPGVPYAYTITATGFQTPVIGTSGLPAWLTLTGNTLSGTPTTADVGTTGVISVTATNSVGVDTQGFQVDVQGPPQIVSTPATQVIVGDLYSYTVVATGSPTPTLSTGALPAWLSFDPQTGVLQGTPAVLDIGMTATIDITASNGLSPDAVQTFDLTVMSATTGGSGGGTGAGCAAGAGATPILLGLLCLFVAARRREA